MHARRGQPDQHVAGDDIAARQDLAALDGADREAREIIVLGLVHAGHLGRLAADQRAAGLPATRGDAADDAAGTLDVELAGREIIEKEQRLCALHDEIVDAHGDEVDADRVVQPGVDGDLQLGADAVVGGDQDRDRGSPPPSGRTSRRSRRDRHRRRGRRVALTSGLIAWTSALPASMSTPESR